MKSLSLLTRRADMTRQAFREYYENSHAPLGMRHFPFRKYLRNHVLESSSEIDFDVIMESYFSDQVDVAAINNGAVRSIMDKDERAFMTQDMIRSARADEQLLSGPPIGVAAPGTRRLMLLLNPIRPSPDDIARLWAADLARLPGVERVSLDTVRQQVSGYGAFPCAAILSLWLEGSAPSISALIAPDQLKLEACVLTQVCETPAEELAARYGT